jgi:glycosyltransferase involved in cell wall biosynthesis
MHIDVSVVMAAYNEERSIKAAVQDVLDYIFPIVASPELVVVDDGSTDQTGLILDGLAATDSRIRVVHQDNVGHGPALIAGLDAAGGVDLVILDSDRQIPLDGFLGSWELYQDNDAVFGVRAVREDSRLRRTTSRLMRSLLWLLFGKTPSDPNIPFKILPRRAWEEARASIGARNLLPSALLAVHMQLSGYSIAEISIPHRAREGSVSHFRGAKLARFCWAAVLTIVSFRLNPKVGSLLSGAHQPPSA